MATHSSVLVWRIPGMREPGGLPSMGSHRVGHDWSDLAAAAAHTWHYAKCLTLVISFNPHLHSPTLRFLSPPCSDGDSGTQNLQSWEDLLVMTQSSVLRRRIILTGCGPAWEELRCWALFCSWYGCMLKRRPWHWATIWSGQGVRVLSIVGVCTLVLLPAHSSSHLWGIFCAICLPLMSMAQTRVLIQSGTRCAWWRLHILWSPFSVLLYAT